jgi:23S rRNA (guanine1835-N2)-methyltransferase
VLVPEVELLTPFGAFELHRVPVDRSGTLRAWDGADVLLIDGLETLLSRRPAAGARPRVLVAGDNFGALTVAAVASRAKAVSFCDSAVAEGAVIASLARNELATRAEECGLTVHTAIGDVESESIDVVLWNVGRMTGVVVEVASHLRRICRANAVVLAAGMDKDLPPQTAPILRRIGDVTTHPGRRKAHLFEVSFMNSATSSLEQQPPSSVHIDELNLTVTSKPGVFSGDRLDVGTRLLADVVRMTTDSYGHVVDLGCGAGTLGLVALKIFPDAFVTFVDESQRAVDSARHNVEANFGTEAFQRSRFLRSNVFADVELETGRSAIDLVLCNPPFHHVNAMTDEVAWSMFTQSYDRLQPGGELWVVGNRHLGYHHKLKRVFGPVTQVGSHPKFVVLACRR